MYELLGSYNKEQILNHLTKNPGKTANEIANNTSISYKNTYKILQELLEKQIVEKQHNNYFLRSDFIEYIKDFSNNMIRNYTGSLFLKNKLDLYNTLLALYPKEDMKNQIDELIDNWLIKKLDDWYCKYYDFENKEYNRVKEIISSKFSSKELNILEVGCGTGRLTKQLADDFSQVEGIDIEEKYINYCNNNNYRKNLSFNTADIHSYSTKEKYDVVIFSWIGLHYQEKIDTIIEILNTITHNDSLIIILDAYYETEYIDILQKINPVNMDNIKLLKEQLNDKLVSFFSNFNQEILFTNYKFDSVEEVINNFKIELTLEESYQWSKKDEEIIREYLNTKQNPTIIQEGLWITTIEKNSTN